MKIINELKTVRFFRNNKDNASEQKKILLFKNFLSIFSSRAIEVLVSFLSLGLIARYLGVDNYGVYSYITTIIYVLLPLIALQINRILIREIIRNRKDKNQSSLVCSGIILRLTMVILLSLGFAAAGPFLNLTGKQLTGFWILFCSEALKIVFMALESVWISREKMIFSAFLSAFSRSLQLILVIFCVYFDLGFVALFMAYGFANLAQAALAYGVVSIFFAKIRWHFDLRLTLFIFKEALPLGLALFLSQFLFRIDTFFLQAYSTLNEVALFNAPYRLIFNLRMLPMAMTTALFPAMIKSFETGGDNFKILFNKLFKLILITVLPLQISCYYFAEDIIFIVFGEEFAGSVLILKTVGQTCIFLFFFPFFTTVLTVVKKQRIVPYITCLGILVNAVLDYILIPVHGSFGAALATFFSYLTVFCIYFYISKKWIVNRIIIESLRIIAAGAIMAFGIYLLTYRPVWLKLITGVIIYSVGLYFTGALSRSSIKYIGNLLRIKKSFAKNV